VSELQALTDRLAEQISRSVAIDDPQMRLQSYSPHYGAVDEYRLTSILHRKAKPDAIDWVRRHGVYQASGWIRVPGRPDKGMTSRVCVPIRWRSLHLGFLWLIDHDESLTPAELVLAERAAEAAADILYRERQIGDRQQSRERELLRNLLDEDPAVRGRALTGLAEDKLIDRDRAVRVLVLDFDAPAGHGDRGAAAEHAITHALRLLPPRRSLHLVRPDHAVLVVAGDRDARPVELAERINVRYQGAVDGWTAADRGHIGIGTEVALDDAHVSYHRARQAARIARALALSPVVEWSELGIYRFLAELPLGEIDVKAVHPAIDAIIQHQPGGYLIETLEAFLDLAGDVKATAEHLAVHRTTLYGRLARIEKIGHVDLRRGSDRLALHLGLKMGHLVGWIAMPARPPAEAADCDDSTSPANEAMPHRPARN